jgi:hypothetical protein
MHISWYFWEINRWVRCQSHSNLYSIYLPYSPRHSLRSIGKTSIITRFMYDTFDTTYQVRWETAGSKIRETQTLTQIRRSQPLVSIF